MLAARSRLLARAVLTQYPALWWAGCRGRVPLHASAVTSGNQTPMLAGPGGAGRSTVLLAALAHGGRTTGDNLAVTDGESIFGVTEPCKVASAAGRRTSHGRRERALAGRVDALAPDRAVLLRRSAAGEQSLRALDPVEAAAALTAATYMAGELRRYWGFAATLTLGTGRGPRPPARARYGHSADLAAARGGAQPWTAPAGRPGRCARPRREPGDDRMNRRLRVATVITRLQAGAGTVALRGALALDPQRFEVVFVIGSGDRLVDQARAAGFTVIVEPTLRHTIVLSADVAAPAALGSILRREWRRRGAHP